MPIGRITNCLEKWVVPFVGKHIDLEIIPQPIQISWGYFFKIVLTYLLLMTNTYLIYLFVSIYPYLDVMMSKYTK